MKNNTYDIPAIKYFFALGNQSKEIKNAFFSFDDIDGLTIGEIKDLIEKIKEKDMFNTNNNDDITQITIFIGVAFNNLYNNFTYTTNTQKLTLTIVLALNEYRNDEKIDEVIENELLKYANRNSLYERDLKLIRCFLQRYRYNKNEEVDLALSSGKPLKRVYTPK